MVHGGAVELTGGAAIACPIDLLCLRGDTQQAVANVRVLRDASHQADIGIAAAGFPIARVR
jgi:lactam utilization protein B